MAHELPPIAIADDGDLEDVRRLLHRLDLPFVDACHGPVLRESLRISNPRCALDVLRAAGSESVRRAFHIVVVDEDSAIFRRELRGGPFDFVVQRPVHPAALRLLILHALYSGPERRSCARVAMDAEVKLSGSLRRRVARLTQLSERGCGLIVSRELAVGDTTTISFPSSMIRGASLRLEGRVVASEPLPDGSLEERAVSVAFRPPNASVRKQLRGLMAAHGVGAAALHPKRERPGEPAPPETETGDAPENRRRSPRKLFRRPVLASANGGVHTLIGRDLSTGGMRVAADARLAAGDEFKLVVYGRGGKAPLLVKAVVARDDGDAGCVLQFRDVGASAVAWLEEAVGLLPKLPSAESGPHVVVSEIIEDA